MVRFDWNGQIIDDIDLVIFDKDGTLMELHHYWGRMVSLRAEMICQRHQLSDADRLNLIDRMGVDARTGRIKPEGPVGLKKREIVMQTAVDYLDSIGIPEQDAYCAEVFLDVDRISAERLEDFVRPIPGAQELVARLAANGCKLAIATTDKTERAWLAMGYLGMKDRMDLVIGADLVAESKPAPETIEVILRRLEIPRERAIMIGDAVTDIQMGINAGVKASIGVCTGLASAESLSRLTPYVITSVSELRID